MRRILGCLILGTILSGCDAQVDKFVDGAQKDIPKGPDTAYQIDSSKKIKLSPGHVQSAGLASKSATMTITPTKRQIKGTTAYSAQVSVQASPRQ